MDVKVEASVITLTAKAVEVKSVKTEKVQLGSSLVLTSHNFSLSFSPTLSIGGHSISAITPENNFYKELAVSI